MKLASCFLLAILATGCGSDDSTSTVSDTSPRTGTLAIDPQAIQEQGETQQPDDSCIDSNPQTGQIIIDPDTTVEPAEGVSDSDYGQNICDKEAVDVRLKKMTN